jgi:uridine phosphorylase
MRDRPTQQVVTVRSPAVSYPILEFDPSHEAVIEPGSHVPEVNIARHCVVCFFRDVVDRLAADPRTRVARELHTPLGPFPVYETDWWGRRLAVFHPGLGAPLCGGLLEEVIALGCRAFVACGSAGTLEPGTPIGHVVVPTSAVRDEGTSYHYVPAGRVVAPSPEALAAVEATLQAHGVAYTLGKTWTTDAFYRETRARVDRRRAEGCITVDMEASAFFALAQFRGVAFAHILYAADDLSGETWDARDGTVKDDIHLRLFELAAEACLRLPATVPGQQEGSTGVPLSPT